MRAVRMIMRGTGRPFIAAGGVDATMMAFVARGATEHVNRFVRQVSFEMLDSAITIMERDDLFGTAMAAEERAVCDSIVGVLRHGLADNWSQVRGVYIHDDM